MKQALILIDIQNFYFLEGPCRLYEPEKAAKQAAKILEHFRKNGDLVLFIQHRYDGMGYSLPIEEVIAIHSIVKPNATERIIQKDYPNSFYKTSLDETLREHNIEKLVIVGNMTHMCVDTSVRAASDLGYEVLVIEDACTTMDLEFSNTTIPAAMVQKAYMAAFPGFFADVMSTDAFLHS